MNHRANQNAAGDERLQCQFARVVKGVDLRSTAGNCAWVRTPQLTYFSDGRFVKTKNLKTIEGLSIFTGAVAP